MNKLFNECQLELNMYELTDEQRELLLGQVKNVCEELADNQQTEDVRVIIAELFVLNQISPKRKIKVELITEMFTNEGDKSAYKKYDEELINHLVIKNKWGGLELDFRHFTFALGDLVLDITNTYGGITVYVNPDTEVTQLMKNTFAGIETINYIKPDQAKRRIKVIGTNKMAGIEFVSTTEIDHLRKYYNKAAYKENKKREKALKKAGKNE